MANRPTRRHRQVLDVTGDWIKTAHRVLLEVLCNSTMNFELRLDSATVYASRIRLEYPVRPLDGLGRGPEVQHVGPSPRFRVVVPHTQFEVIIRMGDLRRVGICSPDLCQVGQRNVAQADFTF